MRVHSAPPPGVELTPGRDIVLSAPDRDGLSLPHGVLLDDHLDVAARQRVDELALEAVRRWRDRFDALLSVEGIPMGDVWDTWLLREVTLPAVRVRYALRAAGADDAAFDERRPALFPFPPEGPPWARRAHSVPLPAGPRRGTLVSPYYSTVPVLDRLARSGSRRVALEFRAPPPRALAPALLRRGAWLPQVGPRALRRAEEVFRRALGEVRAAPFDLTLDGLELGGVVHANAVDILERQGARVLPRALAAGRAAAAGRLDAVLLAFDQAPAERAIVRAAQAHGVPTFVIHHGYMPVSHFIEGRAADHVGVWTEQELARVADRDARVVGNPSLDKSVPSVERDPLHAVVLVQHSLFVSARLDARSPARHLQAAVAALRRAEPRMRITVRPHPALGREDYEVLAAEAGADDVDTTTPGRELLAGAAVCVGALSTMALEAALVGTPVVMLDVEGGDWPAPFNGRGDVPYARDADEAASALADALATGEVRGRGTLLDALGVPVSDPVGRVVDWLDEVTRAG